MNLTLRELKKQYLGQVIKTTTFLGEKCDRNAVVKKILRLEVQGNHVEIQENSTDSVLILAPKKKSEVKRDSICFTTSLLDIPLDELYDFVYSLSLYAMLTDEDEAPEEFLGLIQHELENEFYGDHYLECKIDGELLVVRLTNGPNEQLDIPWDMFLKLVK